MATVTHMGVDYVCAAAIKGDDYIHLLNEDGEMTVTFDGITDFSGFSITDGDWTSPTADHNCYVAVVKDDGMMGKGNHKCSDILPTSGGTITGNIVSNSSSRGFACTVGSYDVRLMANTAGERGLFDAHTNTWLVRKDSSNNVTLNGNAASATTATTATTAGSASYATSAGTAWITDRIRDGSVRIQWSGSMSLTLEGNGYSSDQYFWPQGITNYTFLGPASFFSTSSWFSFYGFYNESGAFHFYCRNHKSTEVTATISCYGLYVRTS